MTLHIHYEAVKPSNDVLIKAKSKIQPINRERAAVKKGRKKLKKLFADFFTSMAVSIAKQVNSLKKSDESEIQRILDELDLSDFVELVGDIDDILTDIAADGAQKALTQIGVNDKESIVNQANEKAILYAHNRAAEMVGKRWVDGELVDNPNAEWRIDEGTREMLRSNVTDAIAEGWSNNRLAEAILDGAAFSEDRAEMIARTETAMADVQGNMAAYRESGIVTGKIWITAGDDLVSEDCALNGEAGEVGLNDSFPSGASEPPDHPNCRCDVIPVLDNQAQDNQTEEE